MRLRDIVKRRRMVRAYRPDPVERDKVQRIVSLARRIPSAGFTQGIYFVVVTDSVMRTRIAEIALEDRYVSEGFPRWLSSAPVHVVLCVNEQDYHRRYQEPDKRDLDGREIKWAIPFWWVDAGAAMMLLLLAAVDEGLGAGFLHIENLEALGSLLALPEEVTPMGVVTVGHPADEQPSGSARRGWKPLDEVVRWERWPH